MAPDLNRQLKRFIAHGLATAGLWAIFFSGCSSAPKKTPELKKLEGKKVALVEIDGEATARAIVEVALVNQLIKDGTFILVPKQDVQSARTAPSINPGDWQAIAKAAGADYALRADVLEFSADEREGYSTEEVDDSQLKKERGDGRTQRIYKEKSLTSKVRVELKFADLSQNDIRAGIAEAEDQVRAEAKNSSAHLPPRLRFLEKTANEAFRRFFERYNE